MKVLFDLKKRANSHNGRKKLKPLSLPKQGRNNHGGGRKGQKEKTIQFSLKNSMVYCYEEEEEEEVKKVHLIPVKNCNQNT